MQPTVIAVILGFLACVTDLHSRRIPNVLTFGGALAGLLWHVSTAGASGLLTSGAGWLLGVGLFFPFFALRGLGAGDVKLLGALGAWLGAGDVLLVGVYAAMAGGVLALFVAWRAGYLGQAVRNLRYFVAFWRTSGLRPVDGFDLDRTTAPRLAYAIPVFTGLLVSIWLH